MGETAEEEEQMHQGGIKGCAPPALSRRHAKEGEKYRLCKRKFWSLHVQYFVKLDKLELPLLEEHGTKGGAQQPDWIQEC